MGPSLWKDVEDPVVSACWILQFGPATRSLSSHSLNMGQDVDNPYRSLPGKQGPEEPSSQ